MGYPSTFNRLVFDTHHRRTLTSACAMEILEWSEVMTQGAEIDWYVHPFIADLTRRFTFADVSDVINIAYEDPYQVVISFSVDQWDDNDHRTLAFDVVLDFNADTIELMSNARPIAAHRFDFSGTTQANSLALAVNTLVARDGAKIPRTASLTYLLARVTRALR